MNILVAVDDSEFADYVADFVVAHEWPADSRFMVLHVIPSLLSITAVLPPPILVDLQRNQYIAARELLDRIQSRIHKRGYEVSQKTAEGDPKRQIMHLAKEMKADVIVMGSHGKSGLARLMLGSVSLSTASSAHCSVMIVRPPAEADQNSKNTDIKEKELVS